MKVLISWYTRSSGLIGRTICTFHGSPTLVNAVSTIAKVRQLFIAMGYSLRLSTRFCATATSPLLILGQYLTPTCFIYLIHRFIRSASCVQLPRAFAAIPAFVPAVLVQDNLITFFLNEHLPGGVADEIAQCCMDGPVLAAEADGFDKTEFGLGGFPTRRVTGINMQEIGSRTLRSPPLPAMQDLTRSSSSCLCPAA